MSGTRPGGRATPLYMQPSPIAGAVDVTKDSTLSGMKQAHDIWEETHHE